MAGAFLGIGFVLNFFPLNLLAFLGTLFFLISALFKYFKVLKNIFYQKAEFYLEKENYKKSRKYFLLSAKHGYHRGIGRAAYIDKIEKRYDSAQKLYNIIMEVPALQIISHIGLGSLAYIRNDEANFLKHADYVHTHYSAIYPRNLYFEKAEILFAKGNYTQAIIAYESALAMNDTNVNTTLSQIGKCAIKLQRYDYALEQYSILYDNNPNEKYLELIVTLSIELRQFDQAKEWIHEAKDKNWSKLENTLNERLKTAMFKK